MHIKLLTIAAAVAFVILLGLMLMYLATSGT